MESIVFLDRDTIGPNVSLTRPAFLHEWTEYGDSTAEQAVERLREATIAITNKAPLREAAIAELPRLKMIAVAATGYDVIDIDACLRRGIIVSNVRGYAEHTVPEHVFALMLSLRRSLNGYRRDVIDGVWQQAGQFCFFNHPIGDLHGSTLGIIGKGVLGKAVGRLGRAFGMQVLYAARKDATECAPDYMPFDEVLMRADVISLHLPLNEQTRGLIAMAEFRKMSRKPLLINTARGGLVDEADLVTALEQGLISGCGFDVLSTEPPVDGNPLLQLADRPNVIITPHVAWASNEAMQTLWLQVIEHIENYHAGTPSNVVG